MVPFRLLRPTDRVLPRGITKIDFEASRTDPGGVATEAEFVAARHGRGEFPPMREIANHVAARHPTDCFELAGLGILVTNRHRLATVADLRLRLPAEEREMAADWRIVADIVIHEHQPRPSQAVFLPRVIALLRGRHAVSL